MGYFIRRGGQSENQSNSVSCAIGFPRCARDKEKATSPSTPASASPTTPRCPLSHLRSASALPDKSSPPAPGPYPDAWNPTHKMPSWLLPAPLGSASLDDRPCAGLPAATL